MSCLDPVFLELIEELKKLPSITQKNAEKIALYLINLNTLNFNKLIETLHSATSEMLFCPSCNLLVKKSNESCFKCKESTSLATELIILNDQIDYLKMNQLFTINQLFFILNLDTIKTQIKLKDEINTKQLINFLQKNNQIETIIFAFNPNILGKKLIEFYYKLIQNYNPKIKCFSLGLGLPYNSEINYADQHSLQHSLINKKIYNDNENF